MTTYNKITALYSRLSVGDEDRDGGESNSIQNQKICVEKFYINSQFSCNLCNGYSNQRLLYTFPLTYPRP